MYKQVIVVRADLKLSKGKLAVQAAHASLESYKKAYKKIAFLWEKEGSKKVVLKSKNVKELLKLKEKCDLFRIPHALIADAGLTELKPGTLTALGIGPERNDIINRVTGSLPLLK